MAATTVCKAIIWTQQAVFLVLIACFFCCFCIWRRNLVRHMAVPNNVESVCDRAEKILEVDPASDDRDEYDGAVSVLVKEKSRSVERKDL